MHKQIVLASSNLGKVAEIQAMLEGYGIEVLPQSVFAIAEVEETGLSFVENAILKARHAARLSNLPAIADDSGLVVDALGGAPGVHSARYAGAEALDAENNAKLLRELDSVDDAHRCARFRCAMVFLRHAEDPSPVIGEGVWEGRILREPHGDRGFGYDPLFWVAEKECTSAELSAEEKNRLSHRGQALRHLLAQLVGR